MILWTAVIHDSDWPHPPFSRPTTSRICPAVLVRSCSFLLLSPLSLFPFPATSWSWICRGYETNPLVLLLGSAACRGIETKSKRNGVENRNSVDRHWRVLPDGEVPGDGTACFCLRGVRGRALSKYQRLEQKKKTTIKAYIWYSFW